MQSGKKTATSALLWGLELGGRKLPTVGDFGVVTNWEGDPLCIVEITEVEIKAFNDVDERFIFEYGEGERSLTWWRRAMWDYYSVVCKKIGREPTEDMPTMVEANTVRSVKK